LTLDNKKIKNPKISAITDGIKKAASKVWQFRIENTNKYKVLKIVLLTLFPALLAFTTELNQTQSLEKLFQRIYDNPNMFIFSIIVTAVIFSGILFITRSAVFSVFFNWVALYTFSWIEYFKFAASGTHFSVTDMAMIGNAADMTKFTTVNIGIIFNINMFIMIVYTVAVFLLNIKIKYKFAKSFIIGFACIGIFASFIVFPVFTLKVYSFFDIENSKSVNSFNDNDKFERLNFIPYFVESATNLFTYATKEPDNYSEETVKNILKPSDTETEETEKINIIYILSESFADFRNFSSENKNGELDSAYKNFDIMRNEGFGGVCIVPTFGGYTARSEFELIFGLPLKSIGTPALPNNKFKYENEEDIMTIPRFYSQNGYETTYIHPFSKTFYNRDEIYSKYGFKNMIFDEDLEFYLPDEDIEYFRKYISDYTVFECITEKIKNSNNPEYIFATTMQNHVPYSEPENETEDEEVQEQSTPIKSEYEYYIDGIKETDKALGYLKEQLENMSEKCIVIFLGDHFPFFISENNKYKELNINSKNCSALYEQNYFVWTNFDFDKSEFEKHEKISLFYIPNIIAKMQKLPKNQIINTILGEVETSPVYSQFTDNTDKTISKNEILDILTYDLTLDEKFALK